MAGVAVAAGLGVATTAARVLVGVAVGGAGVGVGGTGVAVGTVVGVSGTRVDVGGTVGDGTGVGVGGAEHATAAIAIDATRSTHKTCFIDSLLSKGGEGGKLKPQSKATERIYV